MRFTPLLIAAFAALTGSSLYAQTAVPTPTPTPGEQSPGGRWGHHHGEAFLRELNLTSTQQNDLRTYRQQHKAERRSAMAAVLAARLQLQQDVSANDQTALSTDAAALGRAVAQEAQVRAAELNYLKGILTADQLTTWQRLQQEHQSRMQSRLNQLNASTQ